MNDITRKIYPSSEDFFDTLKDWKTKNHKLSFTTGCLDLLHRGGKVELIELTEGFPTSSLTEKIKKC